MPIKMIATDMDGTLLDPKGELDLPRLTAVLDQLEERNIKFVIVGRFDRAYNPDRR